MGKKILARIAISLLKKQLNSDSTITEFEKMIISYNALNKFHQSTHNADDFLYNMYVIDKSGLSIITTENMKREILKHIRHIRFEAKKTISLSNRRQ